MHTFLQCFGQVQHLEWLIALDRIRGMTRRELQRTGASAVESNTYNPNQTKERTQVKSSQPCRQHYLIKDV